MTADGSYEERFHAVRLAVMDRLRKKLPPNIDARQLMKLVERAVVTTRKDGLTQKAWEDAAATYAVAWWSVGA